MRIAHLADLHIGKRVNNFSMIEDQRYILKEILRIIDDKKVDTVIIAGDVYDLSSPSAEAVSLFDDFLSQLDKRGLNILITSGNHDSTERLSFGSSIFSKSKIYISPTYEGEIKSVCLEGINFYLFPHLKPVQIRRYFPGEDIKTYQDGLSQVVGSLDLDRKKTNVAICHQFLLGAEESDSEEVSIGGLDQISYQVFEDFDYVALGHLHKPQKVGHDHIRYSGSPLKYSFSEINTRKSLPLIDIEEGKDIEINLVDLKALRDMRMIKGNFEDLIDPISYMGTNREDYLKVVLTDEEEIVDGLGKLRNIYPNIMSLSYDNQRTREEKKVRSGQKNLAKDPMELFEKFYRLRNNVDLDQDKKKIMTEIINDIWGDK